MNKKQIMKYGMMALGMVLTAGANFVQSKNQDAAMKEEIAKKVAEALNDQAKES